MESKDTSLITGIELMTLGQALEVVLGYTLHINHNILPVTSFLFHAAQWLATNYPMLSVVLNLLWTESTVFLGALWAQCAPRIAVDLGYIFPDSVFYNFHSNI